MTIKRTDLAALQGYIDPPDSMPIECECGWHGTIIESTMTRYSSDAQSWYAKGGREGWHYLCPQCERFLWAYYYKVS